jgi:hypothetical protein
VIDKEDAVGEGRFMVPCMVLYKTIAEFLMVPAFKHGFQSYCRGVVISMGALHHKYDGYVFFRGITKREDCEAKAIEESKRYKEDARSWKKPPGSRVLGYEGSKVVKKADTYRTYARWEKLLTDEGLPSELKIALGVDWKVDDMKFAIASLRIEKATSTYWRLVRDTAIIKMYIDGKAIIPIANALQIGRRVVWNRLKFYGLSNSEDE